MNDAVSESEILEALARPAREAGAFSANLMYIDVDSEGNPEWTEIVADWRLEGEAPIPIGTRFYLPELPFAKLWIGDPNNPIMVSNVSTDDRLDDATRAAMEQGGSKAITIIPLTRGQERVGLVTLNWDQPHEFKQNEKETYTAIIGLASPAVHSRRLFEQAQKQAERETMLNTISQKIQNATSVESVLQIAARELGHALGAPMTVAQLNIKDQ
jgi:GAF domain-containing protein